MKRSVDFSVIKELYCDERKTMREIADIMGISYSTVRRYLVKVGANIRKSGNMDGRIYEHNPTNKISVDDDTFIKLYNENRPIHEIAHIMNTSPKALYRREKELGLKRTKSMMSRDFYDSSRDEEISKLYNEGKSTTEIAKIFNTTHRTILNHLKHSGIKIRSLSESHFIKENKEFPSQLLNYDDLYDMYISRRMSKKEIANTVCVSPNVVDRVLREFGIKVRGTSESKVGVFSGPKHPNWKGGRTDLYARMREYFRWSQVKETMERDGNRCQLCGETHKLQVHHIKPFKEIFDEILLEHNDLDVQKDKEMLYEIMRADERFNDINNLITYCKRCHLEKVHGYNLTSI